MPNRIIRAELLDSESWLGLKDNVDRVAYLACLLTVDNFGAMPAGPHRLVKLWRPYGIDTPEKAAKTFSDLVDVDLLRRYVVDDKPYLYVPRFKQHCRYLGQVWPLSPWATSKEIQLLAKKALAVHNEPKLDVDVDVDVDVKQQRGFRAARESRPRSKSNPKTGTRLPTDWAIPDDWVAWTCSVFGIEPQRAVRISLDFRDYWIGIPGTKGVKLDWLATWRRWCRKEFAHA